MSLSQLPSTRAGAGSMHKLKDNRVSVEFQNNQPGKPKVVFEGSSEDYKENEAVLIFDGKSFRLERLHRAVKQLRHVRLPGDGAASVSALAPTPESRLSPVVKPGKAQQYTKPVPPAVPVEVERIDVGEPAISGGKATGQVTPLAHSYAPPEKCLVYEEPPNDKKWDDQDTLMVDLFGSDDTAAEKEKAPIQKIDVTTEGHQNESDDEIIADVDDDDDEATRGLSAAAIEVFPRYTAAGFEPTYNAVVGAYCWEMRMWDVSRTIKDMKKYGNWSECKNLCHYSSPLGKSWENKGSLRYISENEHNG